MPTVNVTPDVLEWARTEVALSVEEAALKIGVPAKRLQRWESGDEPPTVSGLRGLANHYKRPLAVFFLSERPSTTPLPDDYRLRTISGAPARPTRPLIVAIRQARSWQQTIGRLLESEPDLMSGMSLPQGSLDSDPEDLAAELRYALQVEDREQLRWSTPDDALNSWRLRTEDLGILVFAMPRLDRETCRGFSLLPSRNRPPVIALAKESAQARIFTLLHELTHLSVGLSGICNQFEDQSTLGSVEAFCNKVAANALMPIDLFLSASRDVNPDKEDWSLALAEELAWRLKVSLPAVTLRLHELNRAPIELFDAAMARPGPARDDDASHRGGGGANSWPGTRIAERGVTFSDVIRKAWDRRLISAGDAARAMNMKPKYVARLGQSIESRRTRFG